MLICFVAETERLSLLVMTKKQEISISYFLFVIDWFNRFVYTLTIR